MPGHEVVPASHGADALQLASDRAFDVALVDYHLPFIDGLEVLQRLREVQPGMFAHFGHGCFGFAHDHGCGEPRRSHAGGGKTV